MGVLTPWNIGIKLDWNQFILAYWFIGPNLYWLLGHLVNWFIGILVDLPVMAQGVFPAAWTTDFRSCLSVPVQSQSASLSCRRMQSADHLDYWKIGLLVNWFIGALINWPLELLVTMVNWFIGIYDYCKIGRMANGQLDELTTWFIGHLQYWSLETLVYWNQ